MKAVVLHGTCKAQELNISEDRSQIGEYINAHLTYAGGATDIFTDKAIDEIYRYSAGSMQATNKACTHSLMYAYQRAKKLIDDHMVRTVITGELP
jgi:type II secretory pathway predicted ATPase ExeA